MRLQTTETKTCTIASNFHTIWQYIVTKKCIDETRGEGRDSKSQNFIVRPKSPQNSQTQSPAAKSYIEVIVLYLRVQKKWFSPALSYGRWRGQECGASTGKNGRGAAVARAGSLATNSSRPQASLSNGGQHGATMGKSG